MNRIIYFMMCAIAVCGCSKEVEIGTTPIEGEPMQFTVGSISKANIKETWDGDGFEFVDITRGEEGTKIYKVVDNTGTLEPKDDNDYWEYSFTANSYTAVYPSGTKTSPYQTCSNEDVLVSTMTATNQVGTFLFSHKYALLRFSFTDLTGLGISDDVTLDLTADGYSAEQKGSFNISVVQDYFILPGNYADKITATLTLLSDGGYVFPITLNETNFADAGKTYEQPVILKLE